VVAELVEPEVAPLAVGTPRGPLDELAPGTEVTDTRIGADVGVGTFEEVGATVVTFAGKAVVAVVVVVAVVAIVVLVFTVEETLTVSGAELEANEEPSGIGGASVLGGANGIGGASGFAVLTTGKIVVGADVDGVGFAVVAKGDVITTVGTGTATEDRGVVVGAFAESAGSFTAVCPGGTETIDNVTRGSVGNGAVGTGADAPGTEEAGEEEPGAGGTGGVVNTGITLVGTGFVAVTVVVTGREAALPAGPATVGRGPATMTGAASCPTPTRGSVGPAPAPASTTPESGVDTPSTDEAPAGKAGSDAPAFTGGIVATPETGGAGAIGATDDSGAGSKRARGAAAAPAGLAALVLGLSAEERMRPPALVIEATVKLMSLTRSLAIGGNSTAAL
jgi:hypothetical protein